MINRYSHSEIGIDSDLNFNGKFYAQSVFGAFSGIFGNLNGIGAFKGAK